ncbi:MAG: hypothetical protein IJY09_08870 [Lachnospiraceae bacterium]|nr:hypothetical protein [Lachnospiraceae bacterium]
MKDSKYHLNIGAASMLLLMLVLAMTVFAVLSVRASYRELEMAKKNTESVEAYYAADTAAECMYAKVLHIWRELSGQERSALTVAEQLEKVVAEPTFLAKLGVDSDDLRVYAEKETLRCEVVVDYSKTIEMTINITEKICDVTGWSLRCKEDGLYTGEELEIWDGVIE